MLAPYLVLPRIRLSGALLLCLTIDGGVAYYAIRLAKLGVKATAPESLQSKQVTTRVKTAHYPIRAVAFLSGFVFFALEIAWTHFVGLVINSSVYAFSSVLFFVNSGLGAGGARHGEYTPPRLGVSSLSRNHQRSHPDLGV